MGIFPSSPAVPRCLPLRDGGSGPHRSSPCWTSSLLSRFLAVVFIFLGLLLLDFFKRHDRIDVSWYSLVCNSAEPVISEVPPLLRRVVLRLRFFLHYGYQVSPVDSTREVDDFCTGAFQRISLLNFVCVHVCVGFFFLCFFVKGELHGPPVRYPEALRVSSRTSSSRGTRASSPATAPSGT